MPAADVLRFRCWSPPQEILEDNEEEEAGERGARVLFVRGRVPEKHVERDGVLVSFFFNVPADWLSLPGTWYTVFGVATYVFPGVQYVSPLVHVQLYICV